MALPVMQENKHSTSKKPKDLINRKIALNKLSPEDMEIVTTLKKLKNELDYLHNSFDFVTDPVLTDSYIYEILALNMKYKYYLTLCKERGVIAE